LKSKNLIQLQAHVVIAQGSRTVGAVASGRQQETDLVDATIRCVELTRDALKAEKARLHKKSITNCDHFWTHVFAPENLL
jgi:hypothetical protein